MDCSLPGSSVHGIFQARVLEWGAIAFSIEKLVVTNGKSSKMEVGNEEVQSTIHKINMLQGYIVGFPHSSVGKESACSAGDLGSISGSGRSPGEGNGNPLQHSCLENPMDRGAWQATVHGVTRVRHDLVTKPPQGYIVPNRNIASIYNNSKWSIICKHSVSLCCIPETKITLIVSTVLQYKIEGKRQWEGSTKQSP